MSTIIHEALISLIDARCTLASPTNWTQGQYAKDITGKDAYPNSSDACTYCLQGAIWRSVLSRATNKQFSSLSRIGEHSVSDVVIQAAKFCIVHLPPGQGIFYSDSIRLIAFNDREATHADIIRILDATIKDAKFAFEAELAKSFSVN